jgi:hypothetical protein
VVMEGFPLRPLVTVMAAKFRRGKKKVTNKKNLCKNTMLARFSDIYAVLSLYRSDLN